MKGYDVWIPRWLGETYANLYMRFEKDLFTFQEARGLLSFGENRLAVVFSKLHSKRLLLIFEAGKPRLYRLVEPRHLLMLASGAIANLNLIPQERYVRLLCDAFYHTSKLFNLSSFGLYGSIARGNMKENSDIDIVVVSNDFTGSLGSRIEELCKIEALVIDEVTWLRKHGIHTSLNFYPLQESEAKKMLLLFLDLTEEAIILYDKNQFLEKTLMELKARLLSRGARRILTDKGNWYWDLKPDYKFGDLVEI